MCPYWRALLPGMINFAIRTGYSYRRRHSFMLHEWWTGNKVDGLEIQYNAMEDHLFLIPSAMLAACKCFALELYCVYATSRKRVFLHDSSMLASKSCNCSYWKCIWHSIGFTISRTHVEFWAGRQMESALNVAEEGQAIIFHAHTHIVSGYSALSGRFSRPLSGCLLNERLSCNNRVMRGLRLKRLGFATERPALITRILTESMQWVCDQVGPW